MLFKPTVFQLGANSCVRIFGFLTTAILYRLYELEEVGEYFVLLSLLGIFVALQQMGTGKPLIKYNIEAKKEYEYKILKTKIVLSLISMPIFCLISIYIFNTNTLTGIVITIFGITLILNNISFDYILIAKKKFLTLSVIEFISHFLLFAFFALALIVNSKPLIIFHQIIPSFFLSLLILIAVLSISALNIRKIISSSLISLDFFNKNKILILCQLLIPLITSFDYFLSKQLLHGDELGLMTGLYRYSLLSFGFLMLINRILFSYSLNTSSSEAFKHSRKLLISKFKIVSFLTMLIILYPYLKYVMGLDDISVLLYPGLTVAISMIFMPTFFLEINKIESNDKKVPFILLIGFAVGVLASCYFGAIYLLNIFSQFDLLFFLSMVFLIKWIMLTVGLVYVGKKCNIE